MNVPLTHGRAEISVKNSRFIAEIFPVANQSLAKETLRVVKQQYKDASHVVHAFITGSSGEINGMSDDGEPSGTAGRPVLDVLKGSGLTTVLLTVTRYFGGTLLGTGGLVHAYSESAKAVLNVCQSEPLVEKKKFSFAVEYARYDDIKRIYKTFHIDSLTEQYGSLVEAQGMIVAQEADEFRVQIRNCTHGQTEVHFTSCI